MSRTPLSKRRQCQLLSLNRSSLYYTRQPENQENLALMKRIDELYTEMPFYGVRKMTAALKEEGLHVNHKRVRRLMRLMGLEAVHPKPRTSRANRTHPVYPYLLKGLGIIRPNQVWVADITYIPMEKGFVYLVAIMDWASRYVLSWRVSTSLDSGFCLEALEEALNRYPAPEIFNTDQGCQFTSQAWTNRLMAAGIRISMDSRGRYLDNIFVERLWRTVKYEDVYLKRYETVRQVKEGLGQYFQLYNQRRLHQSLGYKTPADIFYKETGIQKTHSKPFGFQTGFLSDDDLKNEETKMDRLRA